VRAKVLEIYFFVTFLLFFQIEIGAFADNSTMVLPYSCLNNIYVPLDEQCLTIISSATVTRPATSGLLVYVTQEEVPSALGAQQGNLTDTIHGSGNWKYGLYDSQLDEKGLYQLICWGQIISEDHEDPSLVSWYETEKQPFKQYNTFDKKTYGTWMGRLDPTSNQSSLNFGNWSCWQAINEANRENTFPNDSIRLYDTVSFMANHSGFLTIIANHTGNSAPEWGFKPIIAVYGPNGFDANHPCANLKWLSGNSLQPNILAGFGTSTDQISPWGITSFPVGGFQISVEAGERYTFLVTSLSQIKTSSDFLLYFLMQDESGRDIFPFVKEEISDKLKWDSSFVYLDLKTTDINKVYLPHQENVSEDEYPGNPPYKIDANWFQKGNKWLGKRINQDSGFFNLSTLSPTPQLLDSLLYNYGFRPLVAENCQTWEVSISDSFSEEKECGETIIERTFVVTDMEVRTDFDTAMVQLFFRPLNLQDIRLPPFAVYLDCEDLSQNDFSAHHLPGPEVTGFPFFSGLSGFQSLSAGTFSRRDISIGASYEDQAIVVEDYLRYSFRREWTIYDWCQPGTTIWYQQLILVGDWTAPTIDTHSINVVSRSYPDRCAGGISIPRVNATDICSQTSQIIEVSDKNGDEVVKAKIEGKDGGQIWGTGGWQIDAQWKNGELQIDGIPWGEYQIQWIVQDEQGNSDTFQQQVTIIDAITPTCAVEDSLTVSFNNSGILIAAKNLDKGSGDNCYDLDIKISMDGGEVDSNEWKDYLEIGCDQTAFSLPIYLKATEIRPLDEGFPLSSVCRTFIQLKDSSRPRCRDIEEYIVMCDERLAQGEENTDEYWDIYFGDSIQLSQVILASNCSSIELMDNLNTQIELESCGFGTVVRTFAIVRDIAENYWADTCTMTLYIAANHRYQVDFPADHSGNCSTMSMPAVIPMSEWGCDLITFSVQEERFGAIAEECYQIHRSFSVINWCEYVPECSIPWTVERRDWNGDGIKGDELSVLVAYEEVPSGKATQVDSNESVMWILQGASGNVIDSLSLKEYKQMRLCEEDTLTETGLGFFKYKQIISVIDSVPPDIRLNEETYEIFSYSNDKQNGCSSTVQVSGTLKDGCTTHTNQLFIQKIWLRPLNADDYLSEVDPKAYFLEDTVFNITLDLPIGQYELSIYAADGCGNVQSVSTELKVIDAKGPAPICIDGLAVELMPDITGEGAVAEVLATDFLLQTPIEDCSGDTKAYDIVHLKPLQIDPLTRNGSSSLLLYCKDIDFSGLPLTVAIIAEDSAGNKDYCTSQLVLQDNLELCGYGIISGQIRTGSGQAVSDVTIFVNDSLEVTRTRSDGYYAVGPVTWGRDYLLLPQKNGKDTEGISTLDIVLVSRHLLGEKLLENPYQLIAADVNGSNSVSTLDIIWMRKMILKQFDKFPFGKSWRFIPGDWEFSDIRRPWEKPFPEITQVSKLEEDQQEQDFVAIKVGDVNFSYLTTVEARDNTPLILSFQEIALKKGNRYEITFYGNKEEVKGFQFELAYSGIQIEDLVEGKVKAEHINRSLGDENKILISWNGSGASGCLFTLVIIAQEDGLLSEKIKVGSEWINPEGYVDGEVMIPIELRATAGETQEQFFDDVTLRANPVQNTAYFDFTLVESRPVNLFIYNNEGKVVYQEQRILGKGNSTWPVALGLHFVGGLYYFRIEFNQAWYSGSMIRLNH